MAALHRITPCLWFDSEAEEAASFYVGIFDYSKIGTISRYGEAGQEIHGRKPGSVMAVEFELDGTKFTAINGGPIFRFTEAISLQVHCNSQAEVDHYWNRLSEGGDPKAQQCGWLKDKFGLSWQVVPEALPRLLTDPDRRKANRAMNAMLKMKKLDISTLRRAFNG